jgi:hypothetical protein
MPLHFLDRITRSQLNSHPDWIFVFGDNLARKGLGGLAKECRGEPNTVGIPTKKRPSMEPEAFFKDGDFEAWLSAARPAFDRIEAALLDGKTVIFPKGGIGRGLAELPSRAPKIMRAIEMLIETLKRIDGRVQGSDLPSSPRLGRR